MPRTGSGRAVVAVLVTAAIAGVWWAGRSPAAHGREPDGRAGVDALKLELRLDKDQYRTDEPVEATVVFRNTGTAELKVPVAEGGEMLLFFDFLLVGDRGTQYLTRHGEGWSDPSEKQVKLVRLPAGGTYTVKLKDVLPWRNTDAGGRENEQYRVAAIYRDCAWGHSPTYPEYGKADPAVWKGVALSEPAVVKKVTKAEK